MADEPLDASPSTPSAAAAADGVSSSSAAAPAPALRPRREAFEHGLLPIPKLVFPEGTLTQTLAQLKEKLASGGARVGATALAEALQIPAEQAALALGTLAAVLPAEDPALGEDGAGEADLRDVLLFLYIQSYKRLVPRGHSPAVADVWPSTSAFDGCLSALSPIQRNLRHYFIYAFGLQFIRCNSRRFMPSQADEEAHQLSYLQKHIANILTLLADSVDGEGDDSMVLNCHDSVIYILAPLKYATVYGCSDTTIVLGAIGKIPSWFEPQGPTKYNPFTLPEVYWASQRKKHASLEDIQKNIRELEIDDNRKKELACALHAQFKDWLYGLL
nr:unnamed protein product [Digitaria exilis]